MIRKRKEINPQVRFYLNFEPKYHYTNSIYQSDQGSVPGSCGLILSGITFSLIFGVVSDGMGQYTIWYTSRLWKYVLDKHLDP